MRETSAKAVILSVKPETTYAPPPAVGDTFMDSIYVSGITASQSLAAWQFSLAYNKEVLRFDHFTEGPFLHTVGSTMFVQSLEDTVKGIVCAAALLFPVPDVGAVGSGTICYVTFKVKTGGNSPLHIPRSGEYYMDTYLLDPNLYEIPITDTLDGYFNDTTYTPPGIDETFLSQVDRLTLCAYPNPFSGKTVIRYQTPEARSMKQEAILTIYDITGRLVRTLPITNYQLPISNSVTWDGTDNGNRLPSGIYFCKLQFIGGNKSLTKQILLLR